VICILDSETWTALPRVITLISSFYGIIGHARSTGICLSSKQNLSEHWERIGQWIGAVFLGCTLTRSNTFIPCQYLAPFITMIRYPFRLARVVIRNILVGVPGNLTINAGRKAVADELNVNLLVGAKSAEDSLKRYEIDVGISCVYLRSCCAYTKSQLV
jgi:hypothetical protein